MTVAPHTPGVYEVFTSEGGQLLNVGGIFSKVNREISSFTKEIEGFETDFSSGEKLVKPAMIDKTMNNFSKLRISNVELGKW